MTPTEQYIKVLTNLKTGELGLLRTHAGQSLYETLDGFDLFTGLWWPLRQKNERAPRREVAWLVAKLYAFRSIENEKAPGAMLACQLGKCKPDKDTEKKRFKQRFDRMLILPLDEIEPALRWALDLIASKEMKLDWVRLTDDLSIWERESTRLKWVKKFLETLEGGQPC